MIVWVLILVLQGYPALESTAQCEPLVFRAILRTPDISNYVATLCLTGPGITPVEGCTHLDLNDDGHVDLRDVAEGMK